MRMQLRWFVELVDLVDRPAHQRRQLACQAHRWPDVTVQNPSEPDGFGADLRGERAEIEIREAGRPPAASGRRAARRNLAGLH